jgi:hypothetical protein
VVTTGSTVVSVPSTPSPTCTRPAGSTATAIGKGLSGSGAEIVSPTPSSTCSPALVVTKSCWDAVSTAIATGPPKAVGTVPERKVPSSSYRVMLGGTEPVGVEPMLAT